jgi:branched-chain amino acid transport system substrate-binding protein
MERNPVRFAIALTIAIGILLSGVPCAAAQDRPPIKIGFLAPYVGVYAKPGLDMDHGFRIGLEESGYKAGGRQIVMLTEDTEAKPELGPTKARKLIENEKVDLLAGIIHSGVALSIRDIVHNSKIPLVITNAGEPSLTGKLKSPYIFRVSFVNGQQELVAGWYAYHKLGMRRMMLLAPDYSAGHDRASGFKKYFVGSGGQIVGEIYPPLGTNDFGPYLSKVAAQVKSIDGLWVFFTGSASIRLINQYQEYGLKEKVPLFVLGDTVDDAYLPSMRDAALGVKNYLQYTETSQSPENLKFVAQYKAKYKEAPGMWAEQGYVGAKAIVMALNAVHGDIENKKDAFLAALRKTNFIAPRGPFRFDADQNVIFPIYIRDVKKVEGRYENVVLETIPDVDQYWSPDKLKTAK